MYSKRAVVVVKRGDEAIADAIERGLPIRYVDDETMEIRNKYGLLKRRDKRYWKQKIEEANAMYGDTPKVRRPWVQKSREGLAFIIYGISLFVDKYMIIHERREA